MSSPVYLGQSDRYFGEECWTWGGGNECSAEVLCGIYMGRADRYMGATSWYWGSTHCEIPAPEIHTAGASLFVAHTPMEPLAEFDKKRKRQREEFAMLNLL